MTGCANPDRRIFETSDEQLGLRSIQTRSYETADINFVAQKVLSTLQSFGFNIKNYDISRNLAVISASGKRNTSASITVQPKDTNFITVRMNLRNDETALTDPVIYQDFFAALSKAIFFSENETELPQ